MALTRYGHDAPSVFDLLGRGEVDLTAALGWTLNHSPALVADLWQRLGLGTAPVDIDASLEVADEQGRTDLELRTDDALIIIEAKKGWLVPGETQLTKYAGRFTVSGKALIVSLSDSSADWAARTLPSDVGGVPVAHLPWDSIRAGLRAARRAARSSELLWLDQFSTYLAGATAVRDPAEQWVYVVSVSRDHPDGGARSFRDFVTNERVYFHPFGKNWPKRPPVFLGFRWDGRLQQVNRVLRFEIIPNLQTRWPDIPVTLSTDRAHRVHELGPDIPVPALPSSQSLRSRRLWALLDQLLTQPTIVDAERASKELTALED